MQKTIKLNHKGEQGQAFLELAVSIVFLLVLLSAVIDLGWALYEMIAMRDAAQEGAVYGAICQNSTNGYSTVMDRIKTSATAPLDISKTTIEVDYYAPDDTHIASWNPLTVAPGDARAPNYGDKVIVKLSYNHAIVTPLVGSFIGNNWSYPLNIEVSDTVLRVLDKNC